MQSRPPLHRLTRELLSELLPHPILAAGAIADAASAEAAVAAGAPGLWPAVPGRSIEGIVEVSTGFRRTVGAATMSLMGSPQTLGESDRRIVAAWAADCAERVLWLFEAEAPRDRRPRDAITRTRAFARGELGVAEEIGRRFVGGRALVT